MTRERWTYFGAIGALAGLIALSQWHRATSGEPPHFHTSLTGTVLLIVVIAVGMWTGDLMRRYFSNGGRQ